MRNPTIKPIKPIACTLALAGLVVFQCLPLVAQAESLFRSGISYQTSQPYTPRSLFALPRPSTIGDTITVNIRQNMQSIVLQNSNLIREQNINENSSDFYNRVIKRLFGIKSFLPNVDGISNEDLLNARATINRQYIFTDTIACQVVQVLPNGYLVIQGRKSINAEQEKQDLTISGIVNPYFLAANNSISSDQVGNFQMSLAGNGVVSRHNGDGTIYKLYRLMN